MDFGGLVWKAYYGAEWVMRIVYVNLLWILFSIAGLVVLGLFPSTAAMFAVTRKWVMGEEDIPIFKTFWGNFRNCFVQANLVGFSLVILGTFLYVDLRFLQTSDQLMLQLFSFFFFFLLFIYFIVLLYIFPVFVHYQFKTLEYIKYSLIIAIGRPIQSLAMIVGSLITYLILKMIPGLTPFLGGSLLSLVLMWIAFRSFPGGKKIETNHK